MVQQAACGGVLEIAAEKQSSQVRFGINVLVRNAMNRTYCRNAIIMFAAVVAVTFLGEIRQRAMGDLFEVDHPTLFARLEPLWGLLACTVPGIGVGLFSTRKPALISAIAYGIGAMVSFLWHGGNGSIAVGNILPERQFILPILGEVAVIVAIGFAMGLIGAWLRRRLRFPTATRKSVPQSRR
jgi:hypothetical protein